MIEDLRKEFQFLIGRLITIFYLKNFGDMSEFQFLIGRLITPYSRRQKGRR